MNEVQIADVVKLLLAIRKCNKINKVHDLALEALEVFGTEEDIANIIQ